MSRFETEVLTQTHHQEGLARMNAEWVDGAGYNLGNFLLRLCLLKAVKHWPLRSVQIKLIKIGARLVFQFAEVAVPREVFQGVLDRIGRLGPAPG